MQLYIIIILDWILMYVYDVSLLRTETLQPVWGSTAPPAVASSEWLHLKGLEEHVQHRSVSVQYLIKIHLKPTLTKINVK